MSFAGIPGVFDSNDESDGEKDKCDEKLMFNGLVKKLW
jgi:hypothetical protein